jgi:sulfur carrier protein
MERVVSESMATIEVNGQSEVLAAGTLTALLEERGIEAGGRGLAIALNGAVVPRAVWPHTTLRPGDTVEIVQAKQGG